jgi:hypothetical protein
LGNCDLFVGVGLLICKVANRHLVEHAIAIRNRHVINLETFWLQRQVIPIGSRGQVTLWDFNILRRDEQSIYGQVLLHDQKMLALIMLDNGLLKLFKDAFFHIKP